MLQSILASALLAIPAPQDPTEATAEATVLPEPRVVPTQASLAAWRDHLVPAESELRWESIPWHVTFAEGLRAASEQARPLLFWAMNGHPLGCT